MKPTIIDPRGIGNRIKLIYWNLYPELTDYLEQFVDPVELVITVITSLEIPNFYSNFYDLLESKLPIEEIEALDLPLWDTFFKQVGEAIFSMIKELCWVDEAYFEAVEETTSGKLVLYPEGYTRLYL